MNLGTEVLEFNTEVQFCAAEGTQKKEKETKIQKNKKPSIFFYTLTFNIVTNLFRVSSDIRNK